MTYSVWMLIPSTDAKRPWSRIAGGLQQEDAERFQKSLFFESRVMPDQPSENQVETS